jgi:hypothetical protein
LIKRTHTHVLTIHNPPAEPAGVHVRCTYTVWFVYLLCVSSTVYLPSMVKFENMEYDDIVISPLTYDVCVMQDFFMTM